jgi:hypothetical protein
MARRRPPNMPSPPFLGTLTEVHEAIASILQTGLSTVERPVTARAVEPKKITTYPYILIINPRGNIREGTMAGGVVPSQARKNPQKTHHHWVDIALLVGSMTGNTPGALEQEAAEWIWPIYTLMEANYTLNNTVSAAYLDDNYELREVGLGGIQQYGLIWPVHCIQQPRIEIAP